MFSDAGRCRNHLTRERDRHILRIFQVARWSCSVKKNKEKVGARKAVCRRPREYCTFRNACLMHFLAGEKAGDEKKGGG